MEHNFESLASLTNQQVLTRVKMLAAGERRTTAALIGALAELDARRLYVGEGFPRPGRRRRGPRHKFAP
jgi:hypothetical protein